MDLLVDLQRWIYGTISGTLASFAATRDWTTLFAVLPIGIAFGAIHALTPGHGKSILASYLIGSRLHSLRSLAVAGALALTHVGSAVVLALAASTLVTRTLGGVGRSPVLENLSRGLLVCIALWLLWRAWRGQPHAKGEGLTIGVIAGLVPCPLTLFAMVAGISRGVPEAGLTFAFAMLLGVGFTLSLVALTTVFARDKVLAIAVAYGASISWATRLFDGLAGILLLIASMSDLTMK